MTSDPLAFFITFHTYGSWLHGDDAGSVDKYHHAYGEPVLAPHRGRSLAVRSSMIGQPFRLNAHRRFVVDRAIRELCAYRSWPLHALHVRSNHVHLVLSADRSPDRVMNQCKSWATRRMTEAGVVNRGTKVWARHGSTRYLWREVQVAEKCDYVLNQQGAPLEMTDPDASSSQT